MTIRAILRDGRIQPLDPLPDTWADGEELLIEATDIDDSPEAIKQWAEELRKETALIPDEDHERLRRALAENKQAAKDQVRREWGMK